MEQRGGFSQPAYPEIFTSQQVKAVIKGLGFNLVSETEQVYICYCLFHNNTHTPSFAVNKYNGTAICFNDSCGYKGNLITLSSHLSKRSVYETLRFIEKKGSETQQQAVEALLNEKPFEFVEWDCDRMKSLVDQMWSNKTAGMEYLHERGFNDETIKYFNVGYSENMKMVTVPLYNHDGLLVGIIGRGVEGKTFKNSTDLPRKHCMFNLNNAKKCGDICIITESSFDVMSNYQSGFPNSVATLGGSISKIQLKLIDQYFNTIVIMTDNDEPGRKLGRAISGALNNKNILWAVFSKDEIFPNGKKDVTDMTDEERKQCINNAMSEFEYNIRF